LGRITPEEVKDLEMQQHEEFTRITGPQEACEDRQPRMSEYLGEK